MSMWEEGPGPASDCPVERTMAVIGAKWTMLVLRDLMAGPKRFGQLLHSLRGISPTTLTQRLRSLEREGVCARHAYAEIPPRVEYHLTPKGEALAAIIEAMRVWGERFGD